ncbi:ATP-binding protein [Streptomyces cyaneofuscatus]
MSAATPTPVQPNPLGGESYRLTLPNTAAAPRIARDFLTSLLGVSRHPGLVDDARLCVTELVTNAHCRAGAGARPGARSRGEPGAGVGDGERGRAAPRADGRLVHAGAARGDRVSGGSWGPAG